MLQTKNVTKMTGYMQQRSGGEIIEQFQELQCAACRNTHHALQVDTQVGLKLSRLRLAEARTRALSPSYMLIIGLTGDVNCAFKDFSSLFTLIIEDPSLLWDILTFSLCFIFQIKCLIISERKQGQWWSREKSQALEENSNSK